MNAPQPLTFHRVRSASEIDNFIWGLKAYCEAIGIKEDTQKVSNGSLFLKDIALVWWHRRCDDVNRGSTPITTWAGFKREFKGKFYPNNAKREPRATLRHLPHKEGHIYEYIKEFQELLFDIPSIGEQDALFCFLDGLCGCAKTKLERCGVQDIASAIAAAESLIEFKRDSSKG